MAKTPTTWNANSNSVSSDVYDQLNVTYDTIYTHYDGNQDTTQSPISVKTPTVWSQA